MDHSVDAQDFAVLYGFSLFETFAVNGMGVPFMLERHIDRLMHSMKHFDFALSSGFMDHSRLCSEARRYISFNNLKRSIIRATLAFGNPAKHIQPSFSIAHRESPYKAERYEKGFVIGVASFRRYAGSPLLGHKTANRIENMLADKEAAAQNIDDMLFVNTDGYIMETSRSNVFFINYIKGQNGQKEQSGALRFRIRTPALSCGLLPGVVRQWLISDVLQNKDSSGKYTVESVKCAEHDGSAGCAEYSELAGLAECTEGFFTLGDLQDADEIFLTNSAMGIMPVCSINGLLKTCDISLALSKDCRQLFV